MTFFGCKFGFGNCFGAASWSNHWAGCHRLSYKIHFYWFLVSWRGLHLLRFFTFALCLKCRMTIEQSMLISSAPSPVVVRGSALMMALSCLCQPLMAGHCPPHLQGSRVLCKTSLTTTTLCSLALPGPKALWMLRVVFRALRPILNSNKKIAQILFI